MTLMPDYFDEWGNVVRGQIVPDREGRMNADEQSALLPDDQAAAIALEGAIAHVEADLRLRAEVDRWRAEAESWHAQYLRVFAETLVLAERVSVLEAELRSAKESKP